MAQLNRDILREIFYEIVKKEDGFKENIDKFMMAGKEPFNLVLDHCKKANNVVILKYRIIAKLPNVEVHYYDDYLSGTSIPTKMKLFKPISIAIASTLTSLNIKGFSSKLIPMLKSIDQELEEVNIQHRQLKHILEAYTNITNVRNDVTIEGYGYAYEMKFFVIPCRKLTMKRVWLDAICKEMSLDNSYLLQNIRDLTIIGIFYTTDALQQKLKNFAAFLSINFPNVENMDVMFKLKSFYLYEYWDWNSIEEMANQFKGLPPRMKGCICFKLINHRLDEIDETKYPGVQRGKNEYYKIVPITDTLTFKLAYWYDAHQQ